LKQDGASDGASIGFLVATPQTGIDSILVSASFLGWPFALFKVVAAAVTGLVGGGLTEALASREPEEAPHPGKALHPHRGWREGWSYAIDELLYPIWGWLVFGVVVSAIITTWVPAGELAGWAGGGVMALLMVLAISVPLYVCATSSVPIAAALVNAGLPGGAALVFLMAGPATNLATLGAVHRTFGARTVAIYLGTVIFGSVGFGLLFDQAWGLEVQQAAMSHSHTSPLATFASVALVALTAGFALRDVRRWLGSMGSSSGDEPEQNLQVGGMTCGGCVQKLTTRLMAVEGVTHVQVDLPTGGVVVRGQALEPDRLWQAVTSAGFHAMEEEASG
jgi:copper chaperone CopZ